MVQILLSNTDNSIEHQTFVCTHVNRQTVLFNRNMGPYQVMLHQVREDQGIMMMKEYFTFPKAPGLKLPHQLFSVIFSILVGNMGGLTICWEAVSYCPSRLSLWFPVNTIIMVQQQIWPYDQMVYIQTRKKS